MMLHWQQQINGKRVGSENTDIKNDENLTLSDHWSMKMDHFCIFHPPRSIGLIDGVKSEVFISHRSIQAIVHVNFRDEPESQSYVTFFILFSPAERGERKQTGKPAKLDKVDKLYAHTP